MALQISMRILLSDNKYHTQIYCHEKMIYRYITIFVHAMAGTLVAIRLNNNYIEAKVMAIK